MGHTDRLKKTSVPDLAKPLLTKNYVSELAKQDLS
jgi:hypothetical protein